MKIDSGTSSRRRIYWTRTKLFFFYYYWTGRMLFVAFRNIHHQSCSIWLDWLWSQAFWTFQWCFDRPPSSWKYYYNNDHRQLLLIDPIDDVQAQFTTIMPNMQVFVYIVVQREREPPCTSIGASIGQPRDDAMTININYDGRRRRFCWKEITTVTPTGDQCQRDL